MTNINEITNQEDMIGTNELERMVEALLFATYEPIALTELTDRLPQGEDVLGALKLLQKKYEVSGVNVVRIGNSWAIRTAPDLGFLMSKEKLENRKLSRAATETLAIIGYHQPVTRLEIEEIRGVSVSKGTVDLLVELGWVGFGRRRLSPGRPVTYITSQNFLDHFGLENIKDLPDLKELRAAGLLDNRTSPIDEQSDLESEEQDNEDQIEFFEDE
ncbi:MAG: segregation and condensation protein B [Paracoccaceae bacterium]|jgi:segregation and condensation protein B